jgi:pyruvate/2-oxoglutarate dehydrogenase complex dihydrolipoamide dehydrogenase (E3) component
LTTARKRTAVSLRERKILGGGMVGTHAGDMTGEVELAIEMGLF